jgi:hypothetical protein
MGARSRRCSRVRFTIYLLRVDDLDLYLPDALLIASYIAVPVVLGLPGDLRSLPIVAAAFALAAISYQLILWNDDPQLSGIDDLPPVSAIAFVVPFVLLLVFAGAAARRVELAARRDADSSS